MVCVGLGYPTSSQLGVILASVGTQSPDCARNRIMHAGICLLIFNCHVRSN
jgi:hypothetical protein